MDLANIATVASGFSTFVIAILTLFLWRENHLLRKAGFKPKLVAYFEPHPDGTGGLNIAIANVGTGPARDVFFQFKGKSDSFSNYNLILDCKKKRGPIAIIPQDEKISIFFAIGYQLFKPKSNFTNSNDPLPPFTIQLEWKDLMNDKIIFEDFILDVRPYADLPGFVNKPYLLKIADSIDNLGNKVHELNKDVMTLTNVIESNTLEPKIVRKIIGNTEQIYPPDM